MGTSSNWIRIGTTLYQKHLIRSVKIKHSPYPSNYYIEIDLYGKLASEFKYVGYNEVNEALDNIVKEL